MCNSASRADGKVQAALGITAYQDCSELWNPCRKVLAYSHHWTLEEKHVVCHSSQNWMSSHLEQMLLGAMFEVCSRFREHIPDLLEMAQCNVVHRAFFYTPIKAFSVKTAAEQYKESHESIKHTPVLFYMNIFSYAECTKEGLFFK